MIQLVSFLFLFMIFSPFAQATTTGEVITSLKSSKLVGTTKIDVVEPSVVPGIWEITTGANIFYYHYDTKTLVVGKLFSNDGKNLTESKLAALRDKMHLKALEKFPYDISIKNGVGSNIVIEITDPDCPFCRRAYEGLKNKTNITKYIIFATMAHPGAITKVQWILDQPNQYEAYKKMMEGGTIPKDYKPTQKSIELSQKMLTYARESGITGTPMFFINKKPVVGADMQKINNLIK